MLIRNIKISGNKITDLNNELRYYNCNQSDLMVYNGGKFGEDCIGKPSNNWWFSSTSDIRTLNRFTVGFWVYPTRIDGWNDMCGFYTGGGMSFWLYSGGYPVLYSTSGRERVSNIKLNVNTWTYLMYTYDNGVWKSYVDGVFSTQLNKVVNEVYLLNFFQMENYCTFAGKISDFCVWDEVKDPIVPNKLLGFMYNKLYIGEDKKVFYVGG